MKTTIIVILNIFFIPFRILNIKPVLRLQRGGVLYIQLFFLCMFPFAAFSQGDSAPCFNTDSIYHHNTPIYISVNFHVFVDKSGVGQVPQLKCSQVKAYEEAEKIVNISNRLMAANPQQWPRQEPPVWVNNPIRYVLKGVYMHRMNDVSLWNMSYLQRTFGVNPDTEINFYIADLPGSSTGISNQIGGTYGGTENGFETTFNHEMGHLFGLKHANGVPPYDDGCPDTNPVLHEWDANCDGVIQPNEKNRLCWTIIEAPSDGNKNGVDDCKETDPCKPSPCCSWAFQNNNYMLSTGGYQETFTRCQMDKMLTNLATKKCQFITQIGGEAPPNAFISQAIEETADTSMTRHCLILSASTNDASHSLLIYEMENGEQKTVWASGWVSGPAQNFYYTSDATNHQLPVLLKGKTYKAVLDVADKLGREDRAELVIRN